MSLLMTYGIFLAIIPSKAFGKTCDELHITVCTIVEKHTDKIHPDSIFTKQSSKGGVHFDYA